MFFRKSKNTFRKTITTNQDNILYNLQNDATEFGLDVFFSDKYKGFFTNKEDAYKEINGLDGFVNSIANKNLQTTNYYLDSSSIIFAHSILDISTIELCETLFVLDREIFKDNISKQEISIGEMVKKGLPAIIKDKSEHFLVNVSKKSIKDRIELFYSKCKPNNLSTITDYKYDNNKINNIDKIRHEIIHKYNPSYFIDNVDEKITYMQKTIFHLVFVLCKTFDVKLNPQVLKSTITTIRT